MYNFITFWIIFLIFSNLFLLFFVAWFLKQIKQLRQENKRLKKIVLENKREKQRIYFAQLRQKILEEMKDND